MPGLLGFAENIGTSGREIGGLLKGLLEELAARSQAGLLDSRAALQNPNDQHAIDVAIANTLNAGGGLLATKLPTASELQQIIKQTRLHGGGTFPTAGGPQPSVGWAVADVGTGLQPTPPQRTIPLEKLTPRSLQGLLRQNPDLAAGDNLGTWINEGKVYVDPSEVIKHPFAARLETMRRKQLANWNLRKGEPDYGSLDPLIRMALRDAAK